MVEHLIQQARAFAEQHAPSKAATEEDKRVMVDIESVKTGIERLKSHSVTGTGKMLAKQLLGEKKYLGQSPEKFFGHVYRTRGKLVHSGQTGDSFAEFESLASATEQFARDLFLAHLKATMPPS
jgi:hypothetical protein